MSFVWFLAIMGACEPGWVTLASDECTRERRDTMAVLTGLEPAGVWKYFEELSNIPRGSYHEKAASDYCVAFAKAHGLEVWQDQAWSIMMVKEASEGYELSLIHI